MSRNRISRLVVMWATAVAIVFYGQVVLAQTRIDYWFRESAQDYRTAMQTIVDRFNSEHPDIQVTLETGFTSEDDFREKLTTAMVAGLAPDIVYADGEFIISRGTIDGAFVPLDELVPLAELEAIDFVPGIKRMMTAGGRWWGLPFRTTARGLFMNMDRFEEAGLDPMSGPETIEELDLFAQRMTRVDPNSGALLQFGFYPNRSNDHSGLLYLWMFGGGYFNWEAFLPALTEYPENLEAVEWMNTYVDRYGDLRPTTGDFTVQRRQAMRIDSTTALGRFSSENPDLRFWVDRLPAPAGRPGSNQADALSLGIPAGADNPREAARLAMWLVTQEIQLMWYELVHSLPVRVGVIQQLGSLITDPREWNMVETLPLSQTPAPLANEVRTAFDAQLALMRQRQISPRQVLEETQRLTEIIYRQVFHSNE